MYKDVRSIAVPTARNVTLPGVSIREQSTRAPQAGYADLPPGVGFEAKDEPLRRDINLLGRVLGQVLIEQEGRELFEAEEEIRLLCKRLRFDYDPALDGRLRGLIESLEPERLNRIVRAFSVYFQLVNIAERYHRVRRGRQYESSEDNPPLLYADETAYVARLFTHDQDLEDALTLLEVGRRQWARVLRKLPDEAFARTGQHNRRGPVTLGGMVADYIAHIDDHLKFIVGKHANLGKPLK